MLNPTEHDEREYLEQIKEKLLLAIRPYRSIIIRGTPVTRTTVTTPMYQAARKQLDQLGPLIPPELQNLLRDANAIVSTAESIATRHARFHQGTRPKRRQRRRPIAFGKRTHSAQFKTRMSHGKNFFGFRHVADA